jgi:hypothetical protein
MWRECHFLLPEELIHGGVTVNNGVMEISLPTSRRSIVAILWTEYHFILPEALSHGGIAVTSDVVEASLPNSRRSESWLYLICHFILPEELKHGDVTITPSVEDMPLSNSRRLILSSTTITCGASRESFFTSRSTVITM